MSEWSKIRPAALLVSVLVLVSVGPRSAIAGEPEVPAPLVEAVSEALAAWAEYATTGETAGIESAFVAWGPQHRQLIAESAAGPSIDNAEPTRFTIRELRPRRLGSERATVWARVEASRDGYESEDFSWDFDLVRRDGRWRVWTVLAAQRPQATVTTAEPGPTVTTASTSTTTSPAPDRDEGEPSRVAFPLNGPPLPSEPGAGVRIPTLSAWIIVITIVGVALAGYLAPRLDRRTEW